MLRRLFLLLPVVLVALTAACGIDTVRIVAVGDLHGDLDAARRALRLAGAVDEQDRWIGGDMILVQTGDVLDRGDDEPDIFSLLERLHVEAPAAGGAVHLLNANHELMNARLDFRYVTEDGFADYADTPYTVDEELAALPEAQRGRAAAFRPGGPMARKLAERPVILILGETVFVHGGVLPEHVDHGIELWNIEVRNWLLGEGSAPDGVHTSRSPTWNRLYSDAPGDSAAAVLDSVLDRLGVERMVMGHTVQDAGVTAHCSGRAWCIDTGMAAHYGGPVEVLEIVGDEVTILRESTSTSDEESE